MSIDKSLVIKSRLKRHRNVLTRAERIETLKEEGDWEEGHAVFGLPKVRNIKKKVKKTVKAAEETEAAAAAEGAGEAAADTAEKAEG